MSEPEDQPPTLEDFPSAREYLIAHEDFHDRREPSSAELLGRAVRLADESMRAINLQLRRVRGTEPEDKEWLFRVWMDVQFLISALLRFRTVACIAAHLNTVSSHVQAALDEFDRRLPGLRTMRNVSQHLADYAAGSEAAMAARARHERSHRKTAA